MGCAGPLTHGWRAVGLYLSPPERAIGLCVDEKSQVQALDRTRPLLPLRPGLPARRTHDYTRHGAASLFAAREVATGRVEGSRTISRFHTGILSGAYSNIRMLVNRRPVVLSTRERLSG